MADAPNHRSEQTGNPGLDRIQSNVRDLVGFVKSLLARIITNERAHGRGTAQIVLYDANVTIGTEDFGAQHWTVSGTLTANRTIFIPDATDASAYVRWVTNVTTGGFSVLLTNRSGSATVIASTTYAVVVRAAGPARLT